ncbi:hypothetical protein Tco_1462260, partial [Tanacetum coccineum]
MGYLVRAYYSISPTRYYKDDSCWSVDLKSKATEDIISIGSFLEALVLNHYMMAYVNVLGLGVLDIMPTESNGIAIVTIHGDLIECKAVVCEALIPSTHAYNKYKVGSAGSEVHQGADHTTKASLETGIPKGFSSSLSRSTMGVSTGSHESILNFFNIS